MSARTSRPAGMVLTPFERTDGEVVTGRGGSWYNDARVPRAVRTEDDPFGEEHPPRVAEHSPYVDDACGDGRHLFDIIESAAWREVYDDTDVYSHEQAAFCARLTCVRCGKVVEWEGTRQTRHIVRLQVAPMVVGDLVAQHVAGEVRDAGRPYARDYTEWVIYRDGQKIGRIGWGSGSRGRAFHIGRLDAWPAGEHVEVPDPAAALRKVARRDASLAAEPAALPAGSPSMR